eukprot:439412_1
MCNYFSVYIKDQILMAYLINWFYHITTFLNGKAYFEYLGSAIYNIITINGCEIHVKISSNPNINYASMNQWIFLNDTNENANRILYYPTNTHTSTVNPSTTDLTNTATNDN